MLRVKKKMNKSHVNSVANGFPMLLNDTIEEGYESIEEGTIIDLMDGEKFVAKAYYGIQNKGFGWVLSRVEEEEIDVDFFKYKFRTALNIRKTYEEDEETTAYRVFNGEGDGIGGLTIDYLDGHFLVTWYSLGIYQFKALILEALGAVTAYQSVYEKKRFDGKGKYIEDDDFVAGVRPQFPLIVKENGVKFATYLNDGPMIGFFLDQKDVRKRLRDQYCHEKRVLNTFSYTGAFSVSAALGGAAETVSVDLAARSKERTKEHFEINNLPMTSNKIIVEDVFEYFKYAVRKSLLFDVVVLDPPSFARSKKRIFSAAKDYRKLLEQAIAITETNGLIVASTNYSNGDMIWFKNQVRKAFVRRETDYEILEAYQLPSDFQYDDALATSNYLKVLFIKKGSRNK